MQQHALQAVKPLRDLLDCTAVSIGCRVLAAAPEALAACVRMASSHHRSIAVLQVSCPKGLESRHAGRLLCLRHAVAPTTVLVNEFNNVPPYLGCAVVGVHRLIMHRSSAGQVTRSGADMHVSPASAECKGAMCAASQCLHAHLPC